MTLVMCNIFDKKITLNNNNIIVSVIIYVSLQNSTSHETLMLSSEVNLKVTFVIDSVSTSFTLLENEFLPSCEYLRGFHSFQ